MKSSDDPTALTRDFGGEFKIIRKLIARQLDQRGLTEGQEGASVGDKILSAHWEPPEFVLFSLHILYQDYRTGAGDKYEVLGRCLNQALDMAEFLKRNLQLRLQRILSDAYACGSGSLSEAEARDFVQEFCRFRFPQGRPQKQALKREGILAAYESVLELLRPGFNRVDKSVTKMSAVVKAVDWCFENLSHGPTRLKRHRDKVVDQLLRARKPESAAVKLLSQVLGVSDSTVRRRLKET